MNDTVQEKKRTITQSDIEIAAAYFPLLVDLAKKRSPITYSKLVDTAKTLYPDKPAVQSAIPVSTGRRLDVVRMFTNQRGLPDLTSLVIGKSSGECGVGFTLNYDPVKARDEVFAFDWNSVSEDFHGYIVATTQAITHRKRRKRPDALKEMSAFYSENKASLPASVKSQRELIIELLMNGLSPEEAFSEAMQSEP